MCYCIVLQNPLDGPNLLVGQCELFIIATLVLMCACDFNFMAIDRNLLQRFATFLQCQITERQVHAQRRQSILAT